MMPFPILINIFRYICIKIPIYNMNKSDLVKIIAKDIEMPPKDVLAVVNSLIENCNNLIYRGIDVNIQSFVSFRTTTRKAVKARNPRTNEFVDVPKRYCLIATASPKLKARVAAKTVY